MKRLLFTMIVASAMIISLNSCNKDNSLPIQPPDPGGNSSSGPVTLILGTNYWETKANAVFVNTFSNIIPSGNTKSINVSVVTNGNDVPIDQSISFMNGELWATHSQTDVAINYRGNFPPYMTIKIVID